MITGLFQVIVGLILAYFANNIYLLIFARAMQGSGAIIAGGYSWISNSVSNGKERMSIISTIVGVAGASSFAFGPLIHVFVSLKNMFLYSAILIFIAWIVIFILLKYSKNSINEETTSSKAAINILIKDKSFIALNLGAFVNNFIMTGVFFSIPQYLENITGVNEMWKIFMPSVIIIMRLAVKRLDNSKSIIFLIASFIETGVAMLF